MAEITKHDGKEEGERDEGVRSGVDLLVAADTIGVDDDLEGVGELVGTEERRRGARGRDDVHDGGDHHLLGVHSTVESDADVAGRHLRAPAARNKALGRDVDAELVHGVEDRLVVVEEIKHIELQFSKRGTFSLVMSTSHSVIWGDTPPRVARR